ncbi:hypothetical protein Hdeb2414_s0006g00201301 [Helianthus debilis subsp. tardiflorus]
MSGVDRFGAGGDECTPPRFQQQGGDDEYSDGVRFSDYAMVDWWCLSRSVRRRWQFID